MSDRARKTESVPTLTGRIPIVIGHRGACGLRPEHTLASYELAIEHGADFIEPDLVATGDGVLIARHEPELSATTDVAERPEYASRKTLKSIDGVEIEGWFSCDFTLVEIKTLRARQRFGFRDSSFDGRFQIPTLQEVIDLARSATLRTGRTIGLYPETKHPSFFRQLGLPLEETLVQMLHDCGYRGRSAPVFLQSFEVQNLKDLRRLTEFPIVQLTDAFVIQPNGHLRYGQPLDFVLAGDARTYGDLLTPVGLSEIASYADGIGPWKGSIVPVGANGRLLQPTPLVEDAHAAGLLVHPYTFRNEAQYLAAEYNQDPAKEYELFYHLGVDGLFSDFPETAVRVRDAWVHRPKSEPTI